MSLPRLLETSRISWSLLGVAQISKMFDFFFDLFQSLGGSADVSPMSPSIVATWRRLILSATEEMTAPQPLRDLLETMETEETLQRCRGNVAGTLR